MKRYKLCPECGQPMLKKGQKRKHPDDYRHARGCPMEAAMTSPLPDPGPTDAEIERSQRRLELLIGKEFLE